MKTYTERPTTDSALMVEYDGTRKHLIKAVQEIQKQTFDANRLCAVCLHSTILSDSDLLGESIAGINTSASRVLIVPISADHALEWIGDPPWTFHMPGGGKSINDEITENDIRTFYREGTGIAVRFKLGHKADAARRRFDLFIRNGESVDDITPEVEDIFCDRFKIEPFPINQQIGARRPGYQPGSGRSGGLTSEGAKKQSLGIRAVASANGQIFWDDLEVAKRIQRGGGA